MADLAGRDHVPFHQRHITLIHFYSLCCADELILHAKLCIQYEYMDMQGTLLM